ncbi:MAG: selenocysteine-specific translation elongation factor, partial [Acidobacteria bacterium]|nr:selenocysteine-specific translation elongation factor [Acidobacteriota bacterium]
MISIILGTAGHVDHGKTALIRALTGIDTDRLEEEKRRGISIDIGFAHLDLGEARLGFVDVPGHERFVKNMLAGVGGIDAVIFVIAADESIKPQTREHFDICRLLGIPRGVIALTKSDLVDAGTLDLVRLEVEEFVAGSFLAGAPVIAVSSVTHSGLDALREALRRLVDASAARDSSRHFRLPIDRSFSLRGFGTVITGTLIAGSVSLEQELEVHPGGRRLRVRGIQTHNRSVKRASAGERTALNVTGAEASELSRGLVLTEPDCFLATRDIACTLELLPTSGAFKHGAPVHFHAG